MGEHEVSTLGEVRELYGEPSDGVLRKELDHLDRHCRALIGRSPFMVVSTASSDGRCDASPKGGPPGFVAVLDERTLAYGDARGNRRVDSLQNVIDNAHVGILFLIPGRGETLRVNGTATLSRDPELLERLPTGGRPARLAVVVGVQQAYMHCAKAIIRSELWNPEAWPEVDDLPTGAEMMRDHSQTGDLATWEAAIADSYTRGL